jgi:excisionase family DNA binding protein
VPDPDELLTVAEVAGLLRLNQQTIRNWMSAGTLPHVRLGQRRVRIYRRDLDALMARADTRPGDPPEVLPTIWDGAIAAPAMPSGPRSRRGRA